MWEMVEATVIDEGFTLYDLELPVGRHGALRVYITGEDHTGAGVKLDDCARISRRLGLQLDVEDDITNAYTLEVSSPGVNRKLRRPEHFNGAVGQHVRVNMQLAGEPGRAVYGTLLECSEDGIKLKEDRGGNSLDVPMSSIRDARIDFVFEN
jgi:ribosome maturation factor RimP